MKDMVCIEQKDSWKRLLNSQKSPTKMIRNLLSVLHPIYPVTGQDNELPLSTGIKNIMDEVKKAVMDGISPLYKKLPQYFLVV